jgi:hypothetical protein
MKEIKMKYMMVLIFLLFALLVNVTSGYADDMEPVFKKEIKETDSLKLNWVIGMRLSRDYLLVNSHRDGRVNIFKKDSKGEIEFKCFINLAADLGHAGRHLDAFTVLTDSNIFYMSGNWTHDKSDSHGLGLSWYAFDPEAYTVKRLGHIKSPEVPNGTLYLSDNQKYLYLSCKHSGGIVQYRIGKDGTPEKAERIQGEGLGGSLLFSPDRTYVYSSFHDHIGWVKVKNDGSLEKGGSVLIPDREGGTALSVTPDSKYVVSSSFKYYSTKGVLCIFERSADGVLTLKSKSSEKPFFGTVQIVFRKDSPYGYFIGGPESPAKGLNYFKYDKATGNITYEGKVRGSHPGWSIAFDRASGTIYSSGYWSSRSFKIYKVPPDRH